MKLLNVLILYILLVPSIIFSEDLPIDSLKSKLSELKNEEKVELMIEIAKTQLYFTPEETIEFATQAYDLSQKINYFEGEIKSLKLLGAGYHHLSMYDRALVFYKKLIENLNRTDDKKEIATTLNRIGIVYEESTEYNKALDSYIEALKIYEVIGYEKGIGLILNNIGLVYWNIGTHDKALEYYLKALSIFEELDNKQYIAHVMNNLGIVYKSLNNQNKALEFYLKSLKIKEELGDVKGIATSLGNIAIIYKNLKRYNEALQYYQRVLEINEQSDDKWETANTLNNIGNLYLHQRDYVRAQYNLEEGLKLAKEIDAKSNVSNSYFFLSELYNAKKDYKKSLEYFKRYSEINDSIFTEESTDKILELQARYETDQKERENDLLKKDLEISSLEIFRLILLLIASILILAVVVVFFVLRLRTNKKLKVTNKELAISKENTEQIRKQLALINSMLRHDLANNFIVIKTALKLFAEENDENMLKEADIKCDKGLELINTLRNFESSSENSNVLKPIDLKQIIDKITPAFADINIQLQGNCKVRADEALESVIHNIIENARVHGNAKNVIISFEKFSDFNEIKIYNDGTQIPEEIHERIFEKGFISGDAGHTGMGLFLVRQNINRYGGSIYLEDNDKPGVTFVINLKKV